MYLRVQQERAIAGAQPALSAPPEPEAATASAMTERMHGRRGRRIRPPEAGRARFAGALRWSHEPRRGGTMTQTGATQREELDREWLDDIALRSEAAGRSYQTERRPELM